MNKKHRVKFLSVVLVIFFSPFIFGCAKELVLSENISKMSKAMPRDEAASNVERCINDDIVNRLKMVSLRQPGLGAWGGADDLTRLKIGDDGFTFHNIYFLGPEISRDEYLGKLNDTLQSGVKSGLFSEQEKSSILQEEEKSIGRNKIFAKERTDPVLIHYSEILSVASGFNPAVKRTCGINKPLTIRNAAGNWGGPPPYTFFTICVPSDQFDSILASLVALMPHVILEKFL